MSEQTAVDPNDPMMIAWKEYRKSQSYSVTESWALHKEHTEGSLWAAFVQGWVAAKCDQLEVPYQAPQD